MASKGCQSLSMVFRKSNDSKAKLGLDAFWRYDIRGSSPTSVPLQNIHFRKRSLREPFDSNRKNLSNCKKTRISMR